ncbi:MULTISPECIES: hypothetical protein [Salinibacter]|uniref:hypothetical protein n=1 Tax=Salinibacter TaxID=146918 RepID=UPI001ABB3A2A|nr:MULTISPECIES: hypothetical protein [Salinibacter]MCS3650600.1 hypothetical protein [Salinibacter ruber]MCS3653852.1 hypothetical protein [Salinibacter ruber]
MIFRSVMEVIKLTAHVQPDGTLEWPEPPPNLPAGDAEVLLLVPSAPERATASSEASSSEPSEDVLATNWLRLRGDSWTGGALRREDLYGEAGR